MDEYENVEVVENITDNVLDAVNDDAPSGIIEKVMVGLDPTTIGTAIFTGVSIKLLGDGAKWIVRKACAVGKSWKQKKATKVATQPEEVETLQ